MSAILTLVVALLGLDCIRISSSAARGTRTCTSLGDQDLRSNSEPKLKPTRHTRTPGRPKFALKQRAQAPHAAPVSNRFKAQI